MAGCSTRPPPSAIRSHGGAKSLSAGKALSGCYKLVSFEVSGRGPPSRTRQLGAMWCYLGTVEPLDAEVAGYIVAGRSRPIRRRHHVRACRQHEGPTRNGGVLRHGRFVSPHPRLYLQATLPTPSHSSHDGPPALGNGREITDLIAAADPQGYRAFVSIAATNPSDTTAQGADVYTTSNPTTNGWSLANGNLPNPQQAPSAGVPAPRCERLAASPSDHNQVFCPSSTRTRTGATTGCIAASMAAANGDTSST